MGVYDRKGSLQKGKDADILILDQDLNIRAVWAMGKLEMCIRDRYRYGLSPVTHIKYRYCPVFQG